MFDGVLRGQSKLFIKELGKYRFNVKLHGGRAHLAKRRGNALHQ